MPVKRKPGAPQLELDVPPRNGVTFPVEAAGGTRLHYENRRGRLYLGDSLEWLRGLEAETVDLVFADPPYNIKKAGWDDFESHDQSMKFGAS